MILDGIDWDCHIYRLFEDDNLGLYTMDKKAVQYVWSKVDRCILLENERTTGLYYIENRIRTKQEKRI